MLVSNLTSRRYRDERRIGSELARSRGGEGLRANGAERGDGEMRGFGERFIKCRPLDKNKRTKITKQT